ncbi:MAG: DUF4194 domain-containing protein [Coriobacteriales bacterium]|nr:DUF4194 domain-containing protein [Coriobacteriales bacterium]
MANSIDSYNSDADQDIEQDVDLYDEPDHEGLFEGDRGDIPPEARYALTRLIRDRYVSDETPSKYRLSTYALALQYREDVERNLNNLCLTLNVNEKYRVAWASTAPFDGEMPGVVIKRGLVQKRDITLLLITLRIAAQNAELEGRERWYIDRPDIDLAFTTLAPYADEGDAAQVRKNIDMAISEARTCGYIENSSNSLETRYRIMPIVPAILTLERAQELVAQLKGLTQTDEEE